MRKIVFAGGTHSGKTSLTEYFKNEGYEIVSESGIAVVRSLTDELGWEGYRTWRGQNTDAFLGLIAAHQIAAEKKIPKDATLVFLDRGVLDYAAMAAHLGAVIPLSLIEYAKHHPYDIVFICDTLSAEDERAGEGRFFTTEDSLQIGTHAERLYREYGYAPIRLPDIPIADRIALVKQSLAIR